MSAMDERSSTQQRRPHLRRPRPPAGAAGGALRPRLRGAHPHPARGDPAADRGARPARPGGDRHRQDGRLLAPGAAAPRRATATGRHRSRWCWCRPASWPSRCPRRSTATASDLGARVLPVYGGAPIGRQLRSLERGRRRRRRHAGPGAGPPATGAACSWTQVATVVLDEADEMLDMGFAEDLEAILDETPEQRQTVLFSATMPRRARRAGPPAPARPGPHHDRPRAGRGRRSRRGSRQTAYVVPRAAKPAALGRILDVEAPTAAIVFCRTREEVDIAHRDAQRPRLPRRGAARRHEPGAARPGHGPAPRRDGGPAGRHRRRRPRPGHRAARPTSSTTTSPRRRRPTCTASAASAGPGARAWPSPSPSRASTGMLKTIEKVAGATIAVAEGADGGRPARPPAGADPRRPAREPARATSSTASASVVETLSDEFDLMEVALAAVKLAHEAGGGTDDDEEIPQVGFRARPGRRPRRAERGRRREGERPAAAGRPGGPAARLFVGLGREAGDPPRRPGRAPSPARPG